MKEYASRQTFGGLDLFAADTRARATDPDTSRAAAESLDTGTILAQLVWTYREAGASGLTDEEAGDRVGKSGAWKRCADLRRLGMIAPDGRTRTGTSGREQRVCVWKENKNA